MIISILLWFMNNWQLWRDLTKPSIGHFAHTTLSQCRSSVKGLYIEFKLGTQELSEEQKLQLDAEALQCLRTNVNQEIGNSLLMYKNAYPTFKHLEIY